MGASRRSPARASRARRTLYEDIEVHYPKLRLEEEGAEVVCVGLDEAAYRGVFWSLALAARGRLAVPGCEARVYDRRPRHADRRRPDRRGMRTGVRRRGGDPRRLRRRSPAPLAGRCSTSAGRWRSAGVRSPRSATVPGCSPAPVSSRAPRHRALGHQARRRGRRRDLGRRALRGRREPIVTARFPDDLAAFCRAITSAIVRCRA